MNHVGGLNLLSTVDCHNRLCLTGFTFLGFFNRQNNIVLSLSSQFAYVFGDAFLEFRFSAKNELLSTSHMI